MKGTSSGSRAIVIAILVLSGTGAGWLAWSRGSSEEVDRQELQTLANRFGAAMNASRISEYPRYLEPVSLRRFMEKYREHLKAERDRLGDENFQKNYVLKPDAPSVLTENDPVKFFGGIHLLPDSKWIPPGATIFKSVVFENPRDAALVLVEAASRKDSGSRKTLMKAWPVVRTDEGWRLDATTILLQPEEPVLPENVELTAKDQHELAELLTGFINNTRLQDVPRFMTKGSLGLLMNYQASSLAKAEKEIGGALFGKFFSFRPDKTTALDEVDPVKFFEGIELTKTGQQVANESPAIPCGIVGMGKRGNRSQIVVKFLAADDVCYVVYGAMQTNKGWRLAGGSDVYKTALFNLFRQPSTPRLGKLALPFPAEISGKALSSEDLKQIEILAQDYQKDVRTGSCAGFPRHLEKKSQVNLMEAMRGLFARMAAGTSSQKQSLGQMIEFKPDIQSVLLERDVANFFGGISFKPDAKQGAEFLFGVTVTDIAGMDDKAYLIVTMAEYPGVPVESVIPVVRTPEGWRLDAGKVLVRRLSTLGFWSGFPSQE